MIKRSLLLPNASKFLEKIFSNPRSLPQAVNVEVSIAKLNIGYGSLFLFGFNLIKNSAVKCCASAADPPLPHINILPFF